MQNNFLEFGIRQNIKHAPSVLYGLENVQANKLIETYQPDTVDTIGGIFRDGSCGWIVVGAHIEIVSLKNGNRIADYTFGDRRFSNTFIAFVTEVNIDQLNTNLLAIGVHCTPTTSCIYLFAANGSRIVHAIEIEEKLTSCSFIEPQICVDSALNSFDGCIIVGTESGKVLIVDLFVESCGRVLNGSEFFNNEPKLCKIVSSTSFKTIGAVQYAGDSDDIGFGVQLEDVTTSGSVLSILCLTPLLIVAVGFEDGKMLLYDLCTLDAFHIAHPPEDDSPLEKLTFIEPADDPRACVYVWSFHSNNSNAIAVMHSLTYEMKIVKPNGNGFIYKNFERCTTRLTMPIFEKYSKPISCQSITKFVVAEENFLTLCLLSWTSSSGAFVCVFDLNQWYKQQLPDACDWRSSPTFLAIFPLGKQPVLDVWMNGVTVTPFSSLNRPEEHFYPSSLSFDCTLLTTNGSAKLHWLGLQNEALEHLNHSGPYAILEPNRCFSEMVRASLIPQFTDYSYDMNQSLQSKREFLLSIALEYNCVNLLKKCANAWADGSHLSKNPSDGMSLSTLTDWIWNRATSIKECCNQMCVPLFDHSGNSIEPRSQKVLLNFSRQLKRLFQLMDMIVTTHQKYIPGQVLDTLRSQRNSICMATEYQEVLQWLLNMGLLPEVNANQPHKSYSEYRDSSFDDFQAIPYPYETLKSYYATQRRKFSEINPNFLVPTTKSCRILYIDSFIENECNSAVLRSEWKKGFGDGLYPPASLQAMLRTLLVPGVPTERKYMLFVYLFMDLSTVLPEDRYAGVIKNLIKFPAVFKMDPGVIKITQAFWNLDHGEFELAIDEIISPLAQDQNMSMWQRELLIGALILHDVPHLALRALHAPGSPISPSLEIRTLLANNLVADAFQVQRMKRNRDLLFEFFQGCHEQRKWHYLLNLSLNEKEEECLGEFLRSIESSLGENIHFIYLLRRSKYLEAVTFIEDLHHKKRSGHLDLDTPNTILSTYRLTMAPSIRQFSDLYYSLKDDINVKLNYKAKCPKPLSTHLSQGKFDVGGGVYHQSLVHTEQTGATYWENQEKKMCGLAPSNVPFLYGLRVNSSPNNSFDDRVCYPEPFVPSHKRRLNDSFENVDEAPVPKRQRMDYSSINSTILTSFKEATGTTHQSQLLGKHLDVTTEMEDDMESLQTTLNTPVVKSHKYVKKPFSLLERVGTPQSILKSRSSYRGKSISSVASRRSVDSDERSIRFNLPSIADDTNAVAASANTPTVPDVFNFGITQRPSIHSERTPSKLLFNEPITFQPSPSDCTNTPSMSSGRKRVRSISPEGLSNITNCIDVSVEQSYEPKSRQLFVSSEESNDHESENIDTESINQPQKWSSFAALDKMTGQETFNIRNPITEPIEDSVDIPVKGDRTNDSFGRFISLKSSFLTQIPTKEQTQPVERIIPIEIEDRPETICSDRLTETETKFEASLAVGRESLVRDNKVKRRSSIGIGTSNISIPMQRNFLTDSSEYNESTYADTQLDESLFRPRNLLTSTLNLTESMLNVTSTTGTGDDSKALEQTDIETVQIEDSDDSSIVCDIPENIETKPKELQTGKIAKDIIPVEIDEKTYMSSTPFTSRMSKSLQFDVSSESIAAQMHRKKNILTDSTFKESPSHYNFSTWDRSSMMKPRNVLTDSTYKDESITSSKRSSMNSARGSIGDIGNSLVSRKGNDDPILIDITDRMFKDSASPDFDDEYSNDIYDLSSEIDAGLRDDDYDVDDYESDSVDDVIDISSGTEDVADPPIIPKNQKTPTGKLSLPPCNTLGRKEHIVVDESKCSDVSFVTASENSINHLTATSPFDQTMSSLHPEEKDVLLNEDLKVSDVDVVIPVESDVNNVEQIEECIPSADFIGVVDVNQYDITELRQNQVTITYELQDNLLAGNEANEDVSQYTVQYATSIDFVNSDLNNALLHPENVDTIEEPLMQIQPVVISLDTLTDVSNLTESDENLNNAVIDDQGTISAVTELVCEVTQQISAGEDETLIPVTEVLVSAEETHLTSTTSDLNAVIVLDTIPSQDSLTASQQAQPDTGMLVDTYDQDLTETTSGNLNEAILYNQSESEIVEPMETVAVESDTTSKNIDDSEHQQTDGDRQDPLTASQPDSGMLLDTYDQHVTETTDGNLNEAILYNQSESEIVEPMETVAVESDTTSKNIDDSQPQQTEDNEEVVLDIDEILESAVVPDMQKNDEETVQPEADVFSQIPSTSVDALKKSNAENEIQIQNKPKRRLRSNSSDVVLETPPIKLTRKRSGSFTPVSDITILKSESTPNNPVDSPAPRMTRAKSEVKTLSSDSGVSRTERSARAKSEIKTTKSEEQTSLSVNDSIESTSESIDTIPKKRKRTTSRNISSPTNTPDKRQEDSVQISVRATRLRTRSIAEDDDTPDKRQEDTVQRSVRATRSRTRSIAEDDDTASVVSEPSLKSTRSLQTTSKSLQNTRNTRAKSQVTDDDDVESISSTTSKKTRAKAKLLPVISEDLSQEAEAESESYEDIRRLTRGQKAFMAKVAEVAKMVPPPPAIVSRKRQRKGAAVDPEDDDISDTASVASSKTNVSTRSRKSIDSSTPLRQSKRLLEKEGSVDKKSIASKDSDTESVASTGKSTRSRRRSTSSKK